MFSSIDVTVGGVGLGGRVLPDWVVRGLPSGTIGRYRLDMKKANPDRLAFGGKRLAGWFSQVS